MCFMDNAKYSNRVAIPVTLNIQHTYLATLDSNDTTSIDLLNISLCHKSSLKIFKSLDVKTVVCCLI